MNYKFNDGGKIFTGNFAETNDCVVRAVSIVTGHGTAAERLGYSHYGITRVMLEPLKTPEGVDVLSTDFMQLMHGAGFVYASVPQAKFKLSDLPKDGIYIAHTHQHVAAVVNGTVEDVIDAREELLKGYWLPISSKGYNVYKGDRMLNAWPLHFAGSLNMAALHYLNYDRNTLITIKPIL